MALGLSLKTNLVSSQNCTRWLPESIPTQCHRHKDISKHPWVTCLRGVQRVRFWGKIIITLYIIVTFLVFTSTYVKLNGALWTIIDQALMAILYVWTFICKQRLCWCTPFESHITKVCGSIVCASISTYSCVVWLDKIRLRYVYSS